MAKPKQIFLPMVTSVMLRLFNIHFSWKCQIFLFPIRVRWEMHFNFLFLKLLVITLRITQGFVDGSASQVTVNCSLINDLVEG